MASLESQPFFPIHISKVDCRQERAWAPALGIGWNLCSVLNSTLEYVRLGRVRFYEKNGWNWAVWLEIRRLRGNMILAFLPMSQVLLEGRGSSLLSLECRVQEAEPGPMGRNNREYRGSSILM